MAFKLREYYPPDFSERCFQEAPDVTLKAADQDGVAPEGYHSMSIFPEYFKVGGKWLLAEESWMDGVPVYADGKIVITVPRRLKKGDLVAVGRSEDASAGIYLYPDGF